MAVEALLAKVGELLQHIYVAGDKKPFDCLSRHQTHALGLKRGVADVETWLERVISHSV